LDSYGADPRRIDYAGANVDGASVKYAEKYLSLQQTIKDRYAMFEVPYLGKDNDDYVNGQGFCCADAPANAPMRAPSANDNPELFQYYYHSDHLGSTSLITDLDGNVVQHVEYVPFGEVFIEERNNKWNTPYLFNAKELDEETGLYYYGARYYEPRVSLWISADPMQEKYPGVSSYAYCHNNPVNRIDPDGREDHVDDYGNVIARYDNNDKSVYMHVKGTSQDQINEHRTDNQFDGNMGKKIGEIGGNIDVSTIMENILSTNSKKAYDMTANPLTSMLKYKEAVQQNGDWDLKYNENTIFGVAWKSDSDDGTKTTFSFAGYTNMNAADVGNYHAGYMGRRAGIHRYFLWKGAGFAETTKEWGEGNKFVAVVRATALVNPFSKPSGDRAGDYYWNTKGMNDSDRDMLLESLKIKTR
jgi:RHS repeat-associated protein